jgi:hypothetical protein
VFWFAIAFGVSSVLDVLALLRPSSGERDLEVLLLRRQVRILQRTMKTPPKRSRWEKVSLAVLTAKLKEQSRKPIA